MHGNVAEWCGDDLPGNPKDPYGETLRAFRGGTWGSDWRNCRAATRFTHPQSMRINNLGLRLARVPVTVTEPAQ
jgi:formylglycine-generating enzyme required for sulfatase activity